MKRYFFGKDSSGHDYLIPEDLKGPWNKYTENDIDDDDYGSQREFESLFGHMMINSTRQYTFTDPCIGNKQN